MTEGCFLLPPLLTGGGGSASALSTTTTTSSSSSSSSSSGNSNSSSSSGTTPVSSTERKSCQGFTTTNKSSSTTNSSPAPTRCQARPRLQLPGCISRASFYTDEEVRKPIAATPTGGSCLSSLFSASFGFPCCSPSSQSMQMQWGGSPSTVASGASSGRSSRWSGSFEGDDSHVDFFPQKATTVMTPRRFSNSAQINSSIFPSVLSPQQHTPTTPRPSVYHRISPKGKVTIWTSSREEGKDAHPLFQAIPKHHGKGTNTLSASQASVTTESGTPPPRSPSMAPIIIDSNGDHTELPQQQRTLRHPYISYEENDDEFGSCIWTRTTTTPSALHSLPSFERGDGACFLSGGGEISSPTHGMIHSITEECEPCEKWQGSSCTSVPYCAFVEDVNAHFLLIEKLGAGRQGVVYRCQPLSSHFHSTPYKKTPPYSGKDTASERTNRWMTPLPTPIPQASSDRSASVEKTAILRQHPATTTRMSSGGTDHTSPVGLSEETEENKMASPTSRYSKHEVEEDDNSDDAFGVATTLTPVPEETDGLHGEQHADSLLFLPLFPRLPPEPISGEGAAVEEICLKYMVNESLLSTVLERICRLRSPHVIQHYGAIQDRRGQWLMMELARGPELLALIELKHHQDPPRTDAEADRCCSGGNEESHAGNVKTSRDSFGRRENEGARAGEEQGPAKSRLLAHKSLQDKVASCPSGDDHVKAGRGTTNGAEAAQRCLNEDACKRFLGEMLRGIAAVHAEGLIHGDVKAENFVLKEPLVTQATASCSTTDEKREREEQHHRGKETHNILGYGLVRDGEVRVGDADERRGTDEGQVVDRSLSRLLLADLGSAIPVEIAQKRSKGGMHSHPGGTPMYMAPELFTKAPYDGKVDVWAAGVVFALLLTGRSPFGNVDLLTHLYRRYAESNKSTTKTPSFRRGEGQCSEPVVNTSSAAGGGADCRGKASVALPGTGLSTTCCSVDSLSSSVKSAAQDTGVLKREETWTSLSALLSRDFEEASEMAALLDPLIDEEIWRSDAWRNVSYKAKCIARKLLTVDPKKRPTAEAALAEVHLLSLTTAENWRCGEECKSD
ncbi:protein kinase [Cystoisospora suis]|uniref:Protein kinase n=1 Tax=Cystoisospora suis TaxID=483139 RepID=A0A2C6KVV6_9APIC|nr:protein kinase [Cystoisospora suis]